MKQISIFQILTTEISLSRKPSSIRMSLQELQNFVQMKDGGLPLKDCIDLCFASSAAIQSCLEDGQSFAEIIQNSQGKSILQLHALMLVLDLNQALEVQLALDQAGKNLEKALVSQSAYPLFLMAFSYAMILFFNTCIMPAMSIYGDGTQSVTLIWIAWILSTIWMILLMMLTGYLLTMHTPVQIPCLTRLYDSIPVIQRAHTFQLACLFEKLAGCGLSTRKCLEAIASLPGLPYASQCARNWITGMEKGISLVENVQNEPGLDPEFLVFFITGIQGSCLISLLETYQKLSICKLRQQIQRLSLWIQLLSYGCVGALVICVYQVMFTPLSMLETF